MRCVRSESHSFGRAIGRCGFIRDAGKTLELQLLDTAQIGLGGGDLVVFDDDLFTHLGQMAEQMCDVTADGGDTSLSSSMPV